MQAGLKEDLSRAAARAAEDEKGSLDVVMVNTDGQDDRI